MKRNPIRKRLFTALIMTIFLVLSGCNVAEGEGAQSGVSGSDGQLVLDHETKDVLPEVEAFDKLLSAQYRNGKIVQFWCAKKENGNAGKSMDIYLHQENLEHRLLFENISTEFSGQWYWDNSGNYYILKAKELLKLDPKGNVVFKKDVTGGSLRDICQLADGSVYLLKLLDDGTHKLLELDVATGEMSPLDYVALGDSINQNISAGESGLLLLNEEGIYRVDTATGVKSILLGLKDNKYELGMALHDFRVTGEQAAELLYYGTVDTLQMVDIADSRIVITARTERFFNDIFMQECIRRFNQSNETYYVVAQTCGTGMDMADFHEKTNVEIGTGGGPDIVFYDSLSEPESLLEKGVFVDMRPFMEATGIKEEDYYSAAFDFWQEEDAIYAANMVAHPTGNWISAEIWGDNDNPDIETLVDGLLRYQEEAIFQTAWESDQVLEYFLKGSEDLWGMVNWEQDTCDFGGELFTKMLEAAKRYGYDRNKDLPYVSYPMRTGFYTYETQEQLKKEGKIPVGYVFADGCSMRINQTGIMAINSNSDEIHRQGAWEFISYLLSDEVQTLLGYNMLPVKRSAYAANVQREIQEGAISLKENADGTTTKTFKQGNSAFKELKYDEAAYEAMYNLTEEKAAEIEKLLETSKALPTRTAAIIDIITEEANTYFNGSKSVEDVVAVIENRVKLYLEER